MKKILIIGANSKIASYFILKNEKKYNILKTFKSREEIADSFELDLLDISVIDSFLLKIKNQTFDAILFFASIYRPDESNNIKNVIEHLNVNCSNNLYLIEQLIVNWNLNLWAKLIFFTDWWTIQPKKSFIAYSLSKWILKSFIKPLATNYEKYIFLGIDVWPVATNKVWDEKQKFIKKSFIRVINPLDGLVNLVNFLLQEENFFSTGAIIDFTGWTYLVRK
jgi:hypothetical protein